METEKVIKKFIKIIIGCLIAIVLVMTVTNLYIVYSTNPAVLSAETLAPANYDCIMVLGAGVRGGRPSPILRDRLAKGYQLYNQGAAPKLLLSGDHHTTNYDEISAMRDYMHGKNVPAVDIFMDHAGLSTYESMIRAKNVFGVRKIIVVTQKFHISRALYLARQVGIKAVGVPAEDIAYVGAAYRNAREVVARSKDFFVGLLKPSSYIGGEPVDISGDGTVTDDSLK